MKARTSLTMLKLQWLVPVLGVLLLVGAALATEWMPIPPGAYPVWERGLGVSDDGIVVFVFYRPVDLVPETHDFHYIVDVNIDPAIPLLVQGFELWDERDPAPKQVVLENAEGARPVLCFVDAEEFAPKWFSGQPFTILDLLEMESLQFGEASFYHEVLHPDEMINFVARGTLQDGRSFFVHNPATATIVRIGD
ncbi:MAG: hypothetical protein MUF25_04045 [Pirellulaceae bacterium]|nr:hypothetical protein [Pirellulaceae bacterium]